MILSGIDKSKPRCARPLSNWIKSHKYLIQRQQATGKREQSLFDSGIEPRIKPFLLKEGEVLNQGIKATENPVTRSPLRVPSKATASDNH
jgi:hypothetical protein